MSLYYISSFLLIPKGSGGSRLSDKGGGGGGHQDPEISSLRLPRRLWDKGAVSKNIFSGLSGLSLGLK